MACSAAAAASASGWARQPPPSPAAIALAPERARPCPGSPTRPTAPSSAWPQRLGGRQGGVEGDPDLHPQGGFHRGRGLLDLWNPESSLRPLPGYNSNKARRHSTGTLRIFVSLSLILTESQSPLRNSEPPLISFSFMSPNTWLRSLVAALWASLVAQLIKKSACNAGDPGSIPGLRRSPGGGHGNPLQYSCLENYTIRGYLLQYSRTSLVPQMVIHLHCGDLGLIPGLGRSLGGGHGNPLQYSCLENSTIRSSWQLQPMVWQGVGYH